jgi:hypothetical protein
VEKRGSSKRGLEDPEQRGGVDGRTGSLRQNVSRPCSQPESSRKENESGYNHSEDVITNSDVTMSEKTG